MKASTVIAAQRHEPVWPVGYREGDHVLCSCGTTYYLWGSCEFQDRWRRHDDRQVTRQFVHEMNEWLASWFEAPAGYDDGDEQEAFNQGQRRRIAQMMRWAADHIELTDQLKDPTKNGSGSVS